MSNKCIKAMHPQAVETTCVIWENILLPSPDNSRKSSVFSLDGQDRYFQVYSSCNELTTFGKRVRSDYEDWIFSINCRNASVNPNTCNIIIPYAEAEGKYVRLASNLLEKFSKPTLSSKRVLRGNYITMLFLIIKPSINVTQIFEAVDTNLKKRETGEKLKQLECFESLSGDFLKLFDDEKYSDMTLKCGNSNFSVHRNILTARSEVFSRMFDQDMIENKSGVVDIVDLDPSILEQFVKYLYSGTVDHMSISTATELYQAADKYAVYPLKKLCGSYILDNMTKDIVCEMLLLADKTGDVDFLDGAISFAAADPEFLNTNEWNVFAANNSNCAVKVYKKFMKNTC